MKLGLIISLVVVLLLSIVGFLSFWGYPDEPTSATSPNKLAKIELSSELPRIVKTTNEPNEDATELYDQAIAYYSEHQDVFAEALPSPRWSDVLVDLVIKAMHRGQVTNGFLDRKIPLKPASRPEFEDALETIPGVVLQRAHKLFEEGNKARAVEAVKSVWILGRRAFEKNTRLYNRSTGIVLMIDSGQQLYGWSEKVEGIDPQSIRGWAEALRELEGAFREKEELIKKHEPHVGDLINIARNDEDLTFRVEAVLKLGVVKFNPGNRGNARVVHEILTEAKNDPNPMISRAAKAADELTEEQVHRLY